MESTLFFSSFGVIGFKASRFESVKTGLRESSRRQADMPYSMRICGIDLARGGAPPCQRRVSFRLFHFESQVDYHGTSSNGTGLVPGELALEEDPCVASQSSRSLAYWPDAVC